MIKYNFQIFDYEYFGNKMILDQHKYPGKQIIDLP